MTDEYPTAEALKAIETWTPGPEWSGTKPWLPLLDLMKEFWNQHYGVIRPEPTGGTAFVTGGWSGNEDIIAALEANEVAYMMLWLSVHRGGKHVFGESP